MIRPSLMEAHLSAALTLTTSLLDGEVLSTIASTQFSISSTSIKDEELGITQSP